MLGWDLDDIADMSKEVPGQPNVWTDGCGNEDLDAFVDLAVAGGLLWWACPDIGVLFWPWKPLCLCTLVLIGVLGRLLAHSDDTPLRLRTDALRLCLPYAPVQHFGVRLKLAR